MQDSSSLAVFKVTARDQGHYKGPSGAFVTYCNISCLTIEVAFKAIKTSFFKPLKYHLKPLKPHFFKPLKYHLNLISRV